MTAIAMAGLSKAKILVVDDEAHGRLALQHLLDGPDREVMLAPSGQEALRHVATNEFALILLDVRMPGMDGFETAALISKGARSERTPIIFLTGAYEDMASVIRGYAAGAVDYVVKPVDPEVLKSKVAVFVDLYYKNAELATQILERKKVQRALSQANEELESRIRERTESLMVANELLRKEIASAGGSTSSSWTFACHAWMVCRPLRPSGTARGVAAGTFSSSHSPRMPWWETG
jgi:CheY-like chemotaxis protein